MKRIIFSFYLFIHATNCIIVPTQYGKIRGTIRRSRANDSIAKYYYFANVPYARPPINDLRFREPQPPDVWTGIKDVSIPNNFCVQIENQFMGENVVGSEDCLYLEVSVPVSICIWCHKLPVLFWIHGGSFSFSSYHETGPDYFMDKKVVLVQINYRLNVFGFLTTNDEHAVGNIGLKDQVFALEWIQRNIANFGGNPNRVTIFGGSAGSVSTLLHMISPKSAGLFHQAIGHSGVPLNTWALQRQPAEMARKIAHGLGIAFKDNEELVQELRRVDANVLVKAAFNQTIMGFFLPHEEIPFLPNIEPDGNRAFFTRSAYDILQKGEFVRVPFMMGHTSEEGSFAYSYVEPGYLNLSLYNQYPELLVPVSMNIPKGSPNIDYAVEEMQNFFFPNASFTNTVDYINFAEQDVRGVKRSAEMMCYNNFDFYFYVFSYVGSNSLSYIGGAGHYSDVLHLFYPQKPDWTTVETKSDRLIRRRLVKLWTNFAYYGNPTGRKENLLQNVRWPRYCSEETYLNIGNDLTLHQMPGRRMYEFWVQLFNKYGFPPYLTY